MPTIENLRLTISESGGRPTAVVTYQLKDPAAVPGVRRQYVVTTRLMGVDSRPGEDGIDDFIPNGLAVNVVLLPLADPNMTEIFNLQPGDLDEDRRPPPFAALPLEDEIVARVTVKPAIVPLVVDSNVVTRGGLPSAFEAVPA